MLNQFTIKSLQNMAFQAAQSIYNIKLKESSRSWISRVKVRAIDFFINNVKKNNLLIEANVGRFRIQLPFSHELPFILRRSPYYSTNLARIAKYVHEKYVDLTFIDIGANIGDSVALLRTESVFPILCIEGDDYFFSILQINASNFSDVQLSKNYIGELTGDLIAVSVELGGTAHLSQDATTGNRVSVKRLSTVLDDNQLFKHSKMIKIDTDGFDNKIIRGSIDFLEATKPVIFFEYDPFFLSQQNEDGLSIFKTLSEIGYEKLLIYENDGELLISVDINNTILLEDITHFYTGRKGLRYCDICVFHQEDNDLFKTIRKAEINFFDNARKQD